MQKQVRPSSGTAVYPHTPTYVHMPRNFTNGACRVTITVALPTLNFISGWVADSSDLCLPRSKVRQNGRFPAQDANEPPCKT